MDAIKYVASRYRTTPEKVLEHYLAQTGMVKTGYATDGDYELQPNEVALFHDLGVRPVAMEDNSGND